MSLTPSAALNAAARRALRRNGRLAITLRLMVTPPTGASYTAKRSVVARAVGAGDHRRDPRGDRGPVPGDGSNGPNVLAESGVVRPDITKSSSACRTSARPRSTAT